MLRRLRDERGASAVEFALIVPLLVLLVVGIVEFGHPFQVQGQLSAAAREGVRAMALQNDPAAAPAAVRNATSPFDPAVTDAQIVITPSVCPVVGCSTTVHPTIEDYIPF